MQKVRFRQRGNAVFGLIVFLAGVLLIGLSFKLAFDMFLVPPHIRVSTEADQTIKVDSLLESIIQVLLKVMLLILMSGIGSLVATRGIKLYSHRQAKTSPTTEIKQDKPASS